MNIAEIAEMSIEDLKTLEALVKIEIAQIHVYFCTHGAFKKTL